MKIKEFKKVNLGMDVDCDYCGEERWCHLYFKLENGEEIHLCKSCFDNATTEFESWGAEC